MKSLTRLLGSVFLAIFLSAGPAFALGTLVTQEGTTIEASRTLIVRHAESIQIASQVKYGAATDNMIWLMAIPNFNHPADDGVRVEVFANAALDELDALSRPVLTGQCDGEPNDMSQQILQAENFGPGLDMRPATQFYSAAEIEAGELDDYIGGQGFEIGDSLRDNIDQIVNQNFMIVAVRINVGELGVPRVDPIISISYPAERGSNQKIALRPLNDVTSNLADIVIWVLDTDRASMNLPTRTMEFDNVQFVSSNETNYLTAFDEFVGVQQSQVFVVEFAGTLDLAGITDPGLSTAMSESGSTFLTRMHARMVPAALRANAAFVTLRSASGAAYDRNHMVEGFNCQAPVPDAGAMMNMGDGGEVGDAGTPDGGGNTITRADGGTEPDGGGGGGGGGGGCTSGTDTSHAPFTGLLLILVGIQFTIRRQRR